MLMSAFELLVGRVRGLACFRRYEPLGLLYFGRLGRYKQDRHPLGRIHRSKSKSTITFFDAPEIS